MDDAELLKDLRGLDKPPLFENDADGNFFPVSEDDSILLRHMDDVVDTGPDEHHKAIGEVANQMNQHIEIPQIQYTYKVADKFVAVQRHVSPRTTETKASEHQWDDRSGGDADKDVQGEYCWSEGKKMVSICKQQIFKLTVTVCTQEFLKLHCTRSQATRLPRRLGTSCSMRVNTEPKALTLLQRRRLSRTIPSKPRTARSWSQSKD